MIGVPCEDDNGEIIHEMCALVGMSAAHTFNTRICVHTAMVWVERRQGRQWYDWRVVGKKD